MALRIATGALRRRELLLPPATITRPASSRVREAIINVLRHNAVVKFDSFKDLTVLDAYAGSGAVGFEMLSNGVNHVTFCENHPDVVAILRANIAALHACTGGEPLNEKTTIFARACQHLREAVAPCDLVFIDPPYYKGELTSALEHLVHTHWIGANTRVVIEHTHNEQVIWPTGMQTVFKRAYGQPIIHIGRFS